MPIMGAFLRQPFVELLRSTAVLLSTAARGQLITILSLSQEIMEGRRSRKEALCHLDIQAEELNTRTERVLVAAHVEPLSLWHQRLGHLNYKKVLKMASLGSVKGLALFNDLRSLSCCQGCL